MCASGAHADQFTLADFSDVSSLTLNGSASQQGTALQITPNAGGQAGSVYRTAPVTLAPDFGFSTFFQARIGADGSGGVDCCGDFAGADGMTFVLHKGTNNSLGGGGGALGAVGGGTPLGAGLVVELDTWHAGSFDHPSSLNTNGNHVAIGVLNGSGLESPQNSLAQTAPGAIAQLTNAAVKNVWVDYNGFTDQLDVFVSEAAAKPATPTLSKHVNLSTVFGGDPTGIVAGFTGATGGATADHDVLSWSFDSSGAGTTPPPLGTEIVSFDGTQPVTTNGNASFLPDRLRLTDAAGNQSGSAFLSDPVRFPDDKSFNAEFSFEIANGSGDQGQGGPLGADGMTFLIHNDVRGDTAISIGGGNLGIGGGGDGNRITPFLAIELDTWNGGVFGDPNHDHVGINVREGDAGGSSLAATALGDFSGFLNDGTERFVWVDYDGTTDLLEVFMDTVDTKPLSPILSTNVDLEQVFGPTNDLFVGFTGGTGGAFETHDVLSFQITQQVVIPEPTTISIWCLMAAGLAGFGYVRCRRRK